MANYPGSAPLALRLPEEVYSLDGCVTGPPTGRPHRHSVQCDTSHDAGHRHAVGLYMVAPGARLKVGPHGGLYESVGAGFMDTVESYVRKEYLIAGAVGLAAWLLFLRKKR